MNDIKLVEIIITHFVEKYNFLQYKYIEKLKQCKDLYLKNTLK